MSWMGHSLPAFRNFFSEADHLRFEAVDFPDKAPFRPLEIQSTGMGPMYTIRPCLVPGTCSPQ